VLRAISALHGLQALPSSIAQACITSPPYFWQRDYEVEGQIGLEAEPEEYVAKLVTICREIRRVLAEDGTLWLNLGDSYNNRTAARPSAHNGGLGHGNESIHSTWAELTRRGRTRLSTRSGGLKEKDLIGIPWMVAFALRTDGWYLRSDIIWSKPYGKPEAARDRPSRAHEHLFLLSKSARYLYDPEPLRSTSGGNARSVWEIGPTGAEGHGAGFPEEIPRRCILASTRPRDLVLDPFVGVGTTTLVAHRLNRRFVGFDLRNDYIQHALACLND
jgi:site-specific DNA-methyltransferase (cytosine-N4-specific)